MPEAEPTEFGWKTRLAIAIAAGAVSNTLGWALVWSDPANELGQSGWGLFVVMFLAVTVGAYVVIPLIPELTEQLGLPFPFFEEEKQGEPARCLMVHDEMGCDLEPGHVGVHENHLSGSKWYGTVVFDEGWLHQMMSAAAPFSELINLMLGIPSTKQTRGH